MRLQIDSFLNSPTLAVLCRGSSLSYVREVCDKFDNCFLVGQFNKSLPKLQCLKGKNIVPIINKSTIQLSEKLCKKFGIKNLQCTFDGWLTRPMSENRRKLFNKIKKSNPWLSVYEAPPGIRERRGDVDWCTSGIYAVDLAAFYQPKEIIIVGLDFYDSGYFVKEKVHVSIKKNRSRRKEMMSMMSRIIKRDNNIQFKIYTRSGYSLQCDNVEIYKV